MKDIDIGYALFLWKTDKWGCFFCSLRHTNELCPQNCNKEGYYKILMGDDLLWYYRKIDLDKWVERNKKRKEELKDKKDNDEEL